MDVIRQIAKVPTDMQDKPRIPIHIFDCGQDDRSTRPVDFDETNQTLNKELPKKELDAFAAYEQRKG
jgi:hypothetical protein